MNNASLISSLTVARTAGHRDAAMERAEVSDWAVNTIRAYAASRGWRSGAAVSMMAGERRRIVAGRMSLVEYLRCRRTGSEFLLSRAVRRAVWAQLACRRLR